MQLTADQGAWNSREGKSRGKLRWKMQAEMDVNGTGESYENKFRIANSFEQNIRLVANVN